MAGSGFFESLSECMNPIGGSVNLRFKRCIQEFVFISIERGKYSSWPSDVEILTGVSPSQLGR